MRRWLLEITLGAGAAACIALLIVVIPAGAAVDPITAAYGKPTGFYYRTQGHTRLICEAWIYTRKRKLAFLVERCVPAPAKKKHHGPAA